MLLVGFGTYQMFINPELISGSSASAYLTLMGLPALIVGLIKWRFEKDEMLLLLFYFPQPELAFGFGKSLKALAL
jgi:hypothetical protein